MLFYACSRTSGRRLETGASFFFMLYSIKMNSNLLSISFYFCNFDKK